MIKIEDNLNSICCNTRLKYQCSKKKSKYTASDMEIFTDLSELKLVSINHLNKQHDDHEIIYSLPQKRTKCFEIKPAGFILNEDEVVSALAQLNDQKKGSLVLNNEVSVDKKFDSNLKKLIKVVSSFKNEEIIQKKCKNSGIEKINNNKTQKMFKNKSRPAMRLFKL